MEICRRNVDFILTARRILDVKETVGIRGRREFRHQVVIDELLELNGSIRNWFFVVSDERHHAAVYMRHLKSVGDTDVSAYRRMSAANEKRDETKCGND